MNKNVAEFLKYELVDDIHYFKILNASKEALDVQFEMFVNITGARYTLVDYSASGLPPMRHAVDRSAKMLRDLKELRHVVWRTAVITPDDTLVGMARVLISQMRVINQVRLFLPHEKEQAWEWLREERRLLEGGTSESDS